MEALPRCAHKTLPAAANLANLLPTGTVLTFQALIPSFSNGGACEAPANELLTLSLIFVCAAACFFSSFTDSFVGADGKLYYGIATVNGLYILNDDPYKEHDPETDLTEEMKRRYKLDLIDFVHAFVSLVVFLVFAASCSDARRCLLSPEDGGSGGRGGSLDNLILNLPVGVGILASFLFVIFPTRRRGIGCTDMTNAR